MAYELIKVSELPELTTPSDANVLPIQDGDYLKRISFEHLKDAATDDVSAAITTEATARGTADTAILADLAAPYDATKTYALGAYCTNGNQTYRSNTAITTAEAWTAAHWDAVALCDDVSDLKSALTTKLSYDYLPTDTTSGDIASFTDGAENISVKSLNVAVEPVQSGSGDPSPDNVRPISGWTGANVYRTGKNMLSPTLYVGTSYNPTLGTVFNTNLRSVQLTDNNNGTFTITMSSAWQTMSLLLPCRGLPDMKVKISASSSGEMGRTFGYLDKDFKVLTKENSTDTSWDLNLTLHSSADENRAYYYMLITNRSTTNTTITITNPMANIGTTALDYEPYQGNTYTLPFGQTVYGGTLDVVSGKLTKSWDCVTLTDAMIDGATTYSYQDKNGVQMTAFSDNVYRVYGGLSSHAPVRSDATSLNNYMWFGSSSSNKIIYWIGILDALGMTLSEFKTWAKTQTIQLYYKLSSPAKITLTPEEVTILKGYNNIYADCGQVEVVYRADIQGYTDKQIAASQSLMELIVTANHEDSMKASKAYTTGNLLIVNGTLYKATTSIASGATLTVGTNVIATTVAAELAALS